MRRLTIYGLLILTFSFVCVGFSNAQLAPGHKPPDLDSWYKHTINLGRRGGSSGRYYGVALAVKPETHNKKPVFDNRGFLLKDKLKNFPSCTPGVLYNPPTSYTIKKSVQELNYSEGGEGVNPLNGGLMLQEDDLAGVNRFYSSKRVWVYDVFKNNTYWNPCQTLKKPGILGQGWDMHFGRLYDEDGNTVYESPSGNKYTFVSGKTYDGSFMAKRGDSLFAQDGSKIVFTNNRASKFVDPNGNYTSVYYSAHSFSGLVETLADSVKGALGRATYLYYSRYNGTDGSYIMLDSISTKGISGVNLCVKYAYQEINFTKGMLDTGYVWEEAFNSTFDMIMDFPNSYVLKTVIYPNGFDTTYYDYNDYGELSDVRSSSGAEMQYGYSLYSFNMYPADTSTFARYGYELIDTSYTRAVDTVRVKESSSAAFKTTLYQRESNPGETNPEYCDIWDPYGNRTQYTFQYGILNPLSWFKLGYGLLLNTGCYDPDGNMFYSTNWY